MAIYKLYKSSTQTEPGCVVKNDGKGKIIAIPLNSPDNRDYIEYQEWVAAGNTAEAAD